MALALLFLAAAGCAAGGPDRRETSPPELAPCPGSPNCVSSRSSDPDRAMPPLPYAGTRAESLKRLTAVLQGMKRCTIVTATPSYLQAEFRSALFGFVDDVEFLCDDGEQCIHFRSVSRTGYYDFGVNRRRMQAVADRYLPADR